MEQEELLVLVKGQEKIDAAKKMVRECQTGYVIVYDREAGLVYYRHAHSETRIPTEYTEEHINIAHRDFPPQHPEHIAWERLNTEVSGHKRDYYVAKGR
jgi:hypothetical protein